MYSRRWSGAAVLLAVSLSAAVAAQTHGQPETFTSIAIANDNLGSGAGTVSLSIDRWSSEADRTTLITTLREKGPRAMMRKLQDMRPVGHLQMTTDSLGLPVHFAHSTPGDDGGRRILVVTDRPIGFLESWEGSRSTDYPFTVVQMTLDKHGNGTGTLSEATRILAYGDIIELENFTSAPIRLTRIHSDVDDE